MLTIKAEIKRQEQKVDGTYNVKLRFTLNRQVKRLSTSLFAKRTDITRSGDFKKNTPLARDIENLVGAYKMKCNSMQIDLNNYSLDYVLQLLRFDELKSKPIDFISFSRQWIAESSIKGVRNYMTAINSLISFIGRDTLYISDITVSFLNHYVCFLNKNREETVKRLQKEGKRIPSNRMCSLYLGSLRHLFKEAQRKYNDYENNLILIPYSPFDNFKVPRQEATRKRAIDPIIIREIFQIPYQTTLKGAHLTNRFNLAKDCFILSFCLIGMNSADLYNVSKLEGQQIIYNRMKTKDRRLDDAKMVVTIPPMIDQIIDKYRDKSGERVFSFYRDYSNELSFNRAINLGLKEIGTAVGVDDLEFYAARHSWATIAVNKVGIDKYTVHAALNHIDEAMKVTDIYIERDFVNENKANAKVLEYVFGA